MYYLSACNGGLFKSCNCYVLFLPFEKPFKYYEFFFVIPSLYTLEKNSSAQQTEEANML